ncbi:MAG: hypothetical protein ACREJV_05645 [Candidatus Rokuibacteriota bacterium]
MAELTRRYVVMPLATPAPFDARDPDAPFVLKPWKDPAALRALRAYRDNCYPELARDLDEWIRLVEAGPVIRGDVGRRNERHLQPRDADRRPAAQRPAARRPSARRAAAKPKRRRR